MKTNLYMEAFMLGKRTTWIILGLTAVMAVLFILTNHEAIGTTFAGAFIGFASNLLGIKQ